MLEKLQTVLDRYEELNLLLADPVVLADQERYLQLTQEHSALQPLVAACENYRSLQQQVQENRDLFYASTDHEFRELVREELAELENRLESAENTLREALIPQDPNDSRNVIIEIRAGAGGDEAGLFAAVLYRMYQTYAEGRGWQTEIIDLNETGIGGFKEIVFMIRGNGAFSRFKYESGVHRVQRVPVTESGGRIHTSTVTVAVLPEAKAVEIDINPADLQIDTYRASGAGGQHVNKTDSAIRITHRPSGIVVTSQDQRSQHKNKESAMAVLRSRLLEQEQSLQHGAIASERRSQVGTGDRSERIRTYNYQQGRITDHRIGLTLYKLEAVLNGDLDELIDALITADRAETLGQGEGSNDHV